MDASTSSTSVMRNDLRKSIGAIVHLLDNAVAAMFLSFIVGMIGNAILRRWTIYEKLSNRYLFSKSKSYERLGVLWYRKILLATPLRFFNTNIRISGNQTLESLESIKVHIANAEVSHWVGFAAMLVLNVAAWWYRGLTIGLAYLILNILGNLYPCLLQQYNKRRLARVIAATKKRDTGRS
jgi:hypothetical protein